MLTLIRNGCYSWYIFETNYITFKICLVVHLSSSSSRLRFLISKSIFRETLHPYLTRQTESETFDKWADLRICNKGFRECSLTGFCIFGVPEDTMLATARDIVFYGSAVPLWTGSADQCSQERIKKRYAQGEAVPACIFLVLKGSQGDHPLHTTLLARCSVLHPTDAERISRRSVFRWTTDLTKIFAAVGEIWERRRIWRSYSDTTEHRWEIVRRLLRAISHEMRPSVNVAVYRTVLQSGYGLFKISDISSS